MSPAAEGERAWCDWAVGRIEADFVRSADTHLIPLPLPALPDVAIYLKDESSHPTGSLKHRLARSLFLHALCNGWLGPGRPVIEASSGSTAVSEAYFARMLGLPFIAVVPQATAAEKIAAIEALGGQCRTVPTGDAMAAEAARLAQELGGHFMDQFTFAERATDWRSNNNIAERIFAQMAREPVPVPDWIVCGAGTGGTSATIGRFARYHRHRTRVCLADPAGSVFHRHWRAREVTELDARGRAPCLIEGIGRTRVEPSFVPGAIDRVEVVDDAASIGAARALSRLLGRKVGGSTGTNLVAVARLAQELRAAGRRSAIVTLLCDSGERYASTLFNDRWIAAQGLPVAEAEAAMARFLDAGAFA